MFSVIPIAIAVDDSECTHARDADICNENPDYQSHDSPRVNANHDYDECHR